jgi:hypothetical protein
MIACASFRRRTGSLAALAIPFQIGLEFLNDIVEKTRRERVGDLSFQMPVAGNPDFLLRELALWNHVAPSDKPTQGEPHCFAKIFGSFFLVTNA